MQDLWKGGDVPRTRLYHGLRTRLVVYQAPGLSLLDPEEVHISHEVFLFSGSIASLLIHHLSV